MQTVGDHSSEVGHPNPPCTVNHVDQPAPTRTGRRPPPPWIEVRIARREVLGEHMVGLTLHGEGLASMEAPGPAASIRLLVPGADADGSAGDAPAPLVLPAWNGNEFLLPDGRRPVIRTFTPLRFDAGAATLDVEVVRHPGGAVSGWAERCEVGAHAAVSGPGRGFEVDPGAASWLLLGDEAAMPAIGQVLAAIGDTVPTDVVVEVGSAAAQRHLATTDSTRVCHLRRDRDGRPGDSLVEHVRSLERVDPGTHVWAAGEAAAMQAIRKELRGRLSVARDHMTVRGYWKLGTTPPRLGA